MLTKNKVAETAKWNQNTRQRKNIKLDKTSNCVLHGDQVGQRRGSRTEGGSSTQVKLVSNQNSQESNRNRK